MATKCSNPVIDFHDFPNQLPKMMAACEEWGCFRLINIHEVLPSLLMTEMKSVVRSLFDLPVEIKRRNLGVIAESGYVAPTATNPLYESLGLYDLASSGDVEKFCSQLDATPHQKEVITKYVGAIRELSIKIGEKLTKGLGVKGEDVAFENWSGQFRINKYHFTHESVGCSGIQIHTDSSFLTILQDDDGVGALEVHKSSSFIPVYLEECENTVINALELVQARVARGREKGKDKKKKAEEAKQCKFPKFLRIFLDIMATKCSIPVIDFHDFPNQLPKMMVACEEWGCFRLINIHEVLPSLLMTEMKSVVRSLFDLPAEIKRRNIDVIAESGYVPPTATNPLYESLGLYDFASSGDVEKFCSKLDATPHQNGLHIFVHLWEVITKYVGAIRELSIKIGEKLTKGLGVKGEDVAFENWSGQFRINKYHFTRESVGCSGVQIHTDSGFLTILQDDDGVGGLEVHKSGRFIPVYVDPWPNTVVVNLDDLAKLWSNGRLHSVKHRVQCNEATTRLSFASFLVGPREGEAIEPLAQLVDVDHPPLYVPTTYAEYRKLRFSTNLHTGEALELLHTPSSEN
ncbi:hypothetical protein OSB04_027783 [Centaurea solstitialis]|uniref:Fe2OG dioxygenase domain-containing protein n=1 Tax=Centaurea solstitialis TaxID=347529 RepID=A0AA38W008_9ASTR|nr:hypothetical protein OSB04_027783 [Centaurea solstitialis]